MTRADKSPDRNKHREFTRLQQQLFAEGVVSRKLLDAVPSPLLIINEHWRVVYANGAVLSLVGGPGANPGPGLAVGDAFHCVHHRQDSKESGGYQSCRVCGVARLLSRSLKGEEASEDCHLDCDLTGTSASLDLRVWATPLEFHGEHFSILTLVDIGDKRRRELLENTCYHDLLNTLTSIRGVISVMKDGDVEGRAEICGLLERMTQDSIDEINTLRLLEKAEQGELRPQRVTIRTRGFLELIRESFHCHPAAEGKSLKVDREALDQAVESDPQLLRRVIGNMVVNALEATAAGGTVALGCSSDGDGVRLWVHNDKQIPLAIQGQIFRRDVSTKGHSRGVGTYSIRLLSSILGGEVGFTSTEAEGTTFFLRLPRMRSAVG